MTGRAPTGWDTLRSKKKGNHGAGLPRCSRCNEVAALNPCRACATPAELAKYPTLPEGY